MLVREIFSSLASFRTETLPLASARALTFLIAPGVRTIRGRPDEYARSIEPDGVYQLAPSLDCSQ